MQSKRESILVIAGYDPSGGAGILADVKTAENHAVYAHAVCTGFTFQNIRRITRIHWFSKEEIYEQIDLCYEEACFQWVKIGITRNAGMLTAIIRHLKKLAPSVNIIWDPVLKSGSGTPFMPSFTAGDFEGILPQVFLTTPNLEEIRSLYPGKNEESYCMRLSATSMIYLKGGHDEQFPGRDRFFRKGRCYIFQPAIDQAPPKHGSGCVFSSSLTANLARGYSPVKAGLRSKRYIEKFLNSHSSLLGSHEPGPERRDRINSKNE